MSRGVLCAVLALVGLVGCEKPCKKGFQRYGVKCVRSLVADAGVDNISRADGGMVGTQLDSGANPVEPVLDSALMDASELPSTPDAGLPVPPCYPDKDGDGVGLGDPRPCSDAGDAGVGTLVESGGDCDDEDAQRSPSLSDVCGDKIDNDCDGKVDDEANNACGGPCGAQLGHQPGEACNNGLMGACSRPGEYVCNGAVGVVCDAPSASPSAELCGDNVDNDCDGQVNEGDAVNALTWYRDCDFDTVAASALGSIKSCAIPAATGVCQNWTETTPAGKATIDCDDTSPSYSPKASYYWPPAGRSDHDLNCDGRVEVETDRVVVRSVHLGANTTQPYPVCKSPSQCDCATWTAMPATCSKDNQDVFYDVMKYSYTSEGSCVPVDNGGALVLCR